MTEMLASSLPLASLQPVVNAHHEWVGFTLRCASADNAYGNALVSLLNTVPLLQAFGKLDCLLPVPDPMALDPELLALLPATQLILRIPAAFCADADARQKINDYQTQGFRILLEGLPSPGVALFDRSRSLAIHCGDHAAKEVADCMHKLPGPHLAENVNDFARFDACRLAGFGWFAGAYPLHPKVFSPHNNGTSRTRLLNLLGLVAHDADSRDIETLLKRDPALSYHLLKLVNSAVFAIPTQITSFSQAISVLGRRQLQRWLQLMLYARQHDEDTDNPLLARAAFRAGLMEAFSQNSGGNKDEQNNAFMVGLFSLLDMLFGIPLAEIIKPLNLENCVTEALLERSGRLGSLLDLAERAAYDRTPLSAATLQQCGIDMKMYWSSMVRACHWAIEVSGDMRA